MDDQTIRKMLIAWLQANCTEIRIYQEKSIGASVCDLMAVTDCLTGFEIKSDRDNYQRLAGQVRSYDRHFDRNYIVVGERHRLSATDKVPPEWGILVVSDKGIRIARKASGGKPSLSEQLHILWKMELNNLLSRLGMPLYTYKSKDYIIRSLTEQGRDAEIHEALVYELMHRDYAQFDAVDHTLYSNTGRADMPAEIDGTMPVEEMVDALSEQDLSTFTLDRWISLYAKARELQASKETARLSKTAPSIPHTVPYTDIEVSPGVPWVSRQIIGDFVYFLVFDRERWETKNNAPLYTEVNYEPVTGNWFITNKTYYSNARLDYAYGLSRYNALYILEATLNLREIRRPTREETAAALEKQEKLRELFRDWLWRDADRRFAVEESYNRMFGRFEVKQFDGSALRFPEMSRDITLYPYQKDAVQRIVREKNTLLAFDVGAGKTYIMIAAAMKLRQEGISRKNLFVVPNNIVGQWELIFQKMYPAAKLLTVSPGTFKPEMRRRVLKQIQCGDYDGIIMAYSCFEEIPLSSEYVLEKMNEELARIEEAYRRLCFSVGVGAALRREEANIRKTAAQLVDSMHAASDAITFEQLEIGTLFVDEAHNFKNIPIQSRLKNISGVNLKGSYKCLQMQRKVQCVQEMNDGRGVVFATGTPLCNSISDAYAMQMYLQPETMRESHLDAFDNWVKSFARPEWVCEIDVDTSKFRFVERFSRFFNLPELSRMFSSVAAFHAVQRQDGLPEHNGYDDVALERSPELQAYMEALCERTERIRAQEVDKWEDNMLKVSTDGRKAALDLHLVGVDPPADDYSKAARCVTNVMEIYRTYPGCSQIIFCDLSTPRSEGFHVYADLKRRLTAEGVPAREIAFVHSCTNEASRVALYEKVNRGEVRVLIGSTFKLGIGANVQTRLKAIHHLDVPWRPADMVQREGRILRRGNQNAEVRIFRYITKGSFDAYSWQVLETKQRFISQFLSGSAYQRSASDLEANVLSYAQVKALSLSEPLMKTLAENQNELRHLRLLSESFEKERQKAAQSICQKQEIQTRLETRFADTLTAMGHLKAFSEQQIREAVRPLKNWLTGEMTAPLMVLGFTITPGADGKRPQLNLQWRSTVYSVEIGSSAGGNVRRLFNFLMKFPDQLKETERREQALGEEIRELEKAAAAENPYPKQIAALKEIVAELETLIAEQANDKSEPSA